MRIDAFLLNTELDLLEMRLKILDPVMDRALVAVLQQAVGAQGLVPVVEDALVPRAGKHQGRIAAAETLAQAQDAREDLLRCNYGIAYQVHVAQADVTRAAVVLRIRLAEVLQDRPPTADGIRAVAVHPSQFG